MSQLQQPTIISKLPHTPMSIFSRMTELANMHHAINLSQGFPDFPTDPLLIDLVTKYMHEGFNQYAPMAGYLPLRERIAEKYAGFYDIAIHAADEITVTSGGTQALFTVISTLVSVGDEVIIFEPAYDSYRPAIEVNGGKAVIVRLVGPDFSIDWSYVKGLVNDRTKLIIINNPNNPTGKVFGPADIKGLEDVVRDTNMVVLSDEVYEHIVFDERSHLTVLRSSELRHRSYVVASFGKLLHTTGWKLGYIVASPQLTAEFRKVHQFNVFSSNTPMQMAIASYLTDMDYYRELPVFFQQKRDTVASELAESRFEVVPSEGTYFMLLDYRKISDLPELEFATQLTQQYQVACVPVSPFYSDPCDQHLLRICFAKKEETLQSAVQKLRQI